MRIKEKWLDRFIFCKDKKAIYFVAVESTAKENLEILSGQILLAIAPDAPKNPFLSFREAVEYVFEYAKHKRVIFVIDEYPYLADALPVPFQSIGRWWGNNPKERRGEEIDFIAYSGTEAIFGECKWKSTAAGEEVLEGLIGKSGLHTQFTGKYYMLFSKSGFTDALANREKKAGNITLVSPPDMF